MYKMHKLIWNILVLMSIDKTIVLMYNKSITKKQSNQVKRSEKKTII